MDKKNRAVKGPSKDDISLRAARCAAWRLPETDALRHRSVYGPSFTHEEIVDMITLADLGRRTIKASSEVTP